MKIQLFVQFKYSQFIQNFESVFDAYAKMRELSQSGFEVVSYHINKV